MNYKKFLEKEIVLQLFGNKRRLAIIHVIKKQHHASVGYIAEKIGLSVHATSKHLKLLERGGILESVEEGLFRIYTITPIRNKLAKYIVSSI